MNRLFWCWLLVLLGVPALLLTVCTVHAAEALGPQEKGSFDRKLSVTGPVELSIRSESGEIRIHSGPVGAVSIHAEISVRGIGATDKVRRLEQNPPVLQRGNNIQIGQIDNEDLRRDVSIAYDLTVPAKTRVDAQSGAGALDVAGVEGPLTAKTGSGGIKVTDISGEVRVSTGSGDIKVENAGGSVTARTGSGSIHGARLGRAGIKDVAEISTETGSGNITLDHVRGMLRAQTGSGSIEIGSEPEGNWEARSGSGGIHLKLPPKAAFELRAHTGSGGISADYPQTQQHLSAGQHDLELSAGTGGPRIELHTGSGSIHVEPAGSSTL